MGSTAFHAVRSGFQPDCDCFGCCRNNRDGRDGRRFPCFGTRLEAWRRGLEARAPRALGETSRRRMQPWMDAAGGQH